MGIYTYAIMATRTLNTKRGEGEKEHITGRTLLSPSPFALLISAPRFLLPAVLCCARNVPYEVIQPLCSVSLSHWIAFRPPHPPPLCASSRRRGVNNILVLV